MGDFVAPGRLRDAPGTLRYESREPTNRLLDRKGRPKGGFCGASLSERLDRFAKECGDMKNLKDFGTLNKSEKSKNLENLKIMKKLKI